MADSDTIAAVATPPGTGGIAVIRISGPDARRVLERACGPREYAHGQLFHSRVLRGGEVLDECMAVLFYAPRSYTGEDLAELHCHGSAVGVKNVLRHVCGCGARPAQPGEFTRRAFLNGKMDLSQAEAVCEFISARSQAGAAASMKQLRGVLKEEILRCQNLLTDILAEVEAAVEYPEEDLEPQVTASIQPVLQKLEDDLRSLARTFDSGQVVKNGVDVTIAGKPNVGKSSLLNALAKSDRAIVADVPGTTRDTVEHALSVGGIQINLKDTAGIHDTDDIIEIEGVKRAKSAINEGNIVIFVLDAQAGPDERDQRVWEALKGREDEVLVVLNKIDASEGRSERAALRAYPAALRVSAKRGDGIAALERAIYEKLRVDEKLPDLLITSERHRASLLCAADAIGEAIDALGAGIDMDCVTIDLSEAWRRLGEITGKTVSEQIIDRIFEKFCLGK